MEMISGYSRRQALDDGVLVDAIDEVRKDIPGFKNPFKHPVAFTRSAWDELVAWTELDERRHRGLGQSTAGRLNDVLSLAIHYAQRTHSPDPDPSTVIGRVGVVSRTSGETELRQFKAVCSAGDEGEPVITFMLPDED